MLKNFARALGVDAEKRELERLTEKIQSINELEDSFTKYSSEDLRARTALFKQRIAGGETLDDVLPEAFALVREASKRTIGLRHFDIQLIGGIALHEGKIAEMRTGEGKTLVATLPLYLNALAGRGAHLVTVNDYLARRDAKWMAPIYHALGLSVGVLQMSSRTGSARNAFLVDLEKRDSREEEDQLVLVPRRQAYHADITYGTNNEYGFDYLRDNLVMDINQRVQRRHHYAIIDEVDNILIDEARTPLIISGPASEDVEWYKRMSAVVKQLDPQDFDYDEKDRSIALTEIGEIHVEELLNIPLRDPDRPEDITQEQARLLGFLEQALRAQILYRKNKDYIVQNNEVIIVDEFTGRLMPGRRWSEGLHQAVEAKEDVPVKPENVTHATITLQNYFRKYEKLAGMTGTALTESEEFSTIYDLDVIEIPTNLDYEASRENSELVVREARDEENYTYTYYTAREETKDKPLFWKRKDYPDVVYRSIEGKLRAIVLEILRLHVLGRPQLVGTSSIEHSEHLSGRLGAESLRRLLTVELLRQTFFDKNQIQVVEKTYPELEFLNTPLAELDQAAMRRFGQTLGLQNTNLESHENLNILLSILNLDAINRDRLAQAILGGVTHNVLNARKHDQEALIIASAGAFGAVTIATNMAGRGVDIKLGGEMDEFILADVKLVLRTNDIDPYGLNLDEIARNLKELDEELYGENAESVSIFLTQLENMNRVRDLGGLHVIGSERHDARRIDNQLRGRAGRQGDPGSSRFYLSLEDDLMRMFGGERAENMMRFFKVDPSIPLESKMLGRLVENAQERVEGRNFDIRKHLLDYDDVLNDQRERIYAQRDLVLQKKDLEEDVLGMLRTELNLRVPLSLADPDGNWKLLAFLEEIQPTIEFPTTGQRVISYLIKLTSRMLADRIGDADSSDQTHKAALALAVETLQAEQSHILSQTALLLENTRKSFNRQLKERLELLDIFCDNVEQYAESSSADLRAEIEKLVGLKVNLPADFKTMLTNEPDTSIEVVRESARSALRLLFLSRLKFTLERRISANLPLDIEVLSRTDWQEINQKITVVVEKVLQERNEILTRSGNQIDHNIQAILRKQSEAGTGSSDLVQLVTGMGAGTQMVINNRTHERVSRKVNLLNYVYLAAGEFDGRSTEEITVDVLAHMEGVQEELGTIWGRIELDHLAQSYQTISNLPEGFLEGLMEYFDGAPDDIQGVSLAEVAAKTDGPVFDAFAKSTQARIYRHILLREISDLWMEHLTRMEALRVSIRMEAYAQRDPLVQYKSVSTGQFKDLLSAIRMGVISKMFRMQPARRQQTAAPEVSEETSQPEKSNSKKKRKRHKKRK